MNRRAFLLSAACASIFSKLVGVRSDRALAIDACSEQPPDMSAGGAGGDSSTVDLTRISEMEEPVVYGEWRMANGSTISIGPVEERFRIRSTEFDLLEFHDA